MDDNLEDQNEKPDGKDATQRSVIVIEFDSPSSIRFNLQSSGISAMQLLLLSEYFEFIGKNALAQEAAMQMQNRMQEADRNRIITPQDIRKVERIS